MKFDNLKEIIHNDSAKRRENYILQKKQKFLESKENIDANKNQLAERKNKFNLKKIFKPRKSKSLTDFDIKKK